MPIQEGDKIPSVTLKHLTDEGMQEISTDDIFKGQKVIMFAVPGAFTPTCSNQHLPGFLSHADDFKAKGIDRVVCMAVNDPFVMKAWGTHAGVADKVMMLPDGNGEFTRALGLEMDGSGVSLGQRSKRFAMLVEDGVVKALGVDDKGLGASSAEAMLAKLDA
ncbi:MAG: redoxin family protein [Alphaproteobacteria bacterium]|jgi:peroxiredoxin|nr:redoxin family protein [Alphaproteobacteria bacterium]